MTDDNEIVLRERSTPSKLRYMSRKLIETHDQLIDRDVDKQRTTILAIALQLDWMAQAAEGDAGPNPTPGHVNEPGRAKEA